MKPQSFILKSGELYWITSGNWAPRADYVKIDDSQQDELKNRIYDIDPGRNTGVDTYFVNEHEIFTINTEEEIEVVGVPCGGEACPSRWGAECIHSKKVARIIPKKADTKDHECTMDLMTDVCVYSCECGKIEVASNLSYHDKPKTYVPEPEKAEESEDELWNEVMSSYAHKFYHHSNLSENPIIQSIKKHFEIKRKA